MTSPVAARKTTDKASGRAADRGVDKARALPSGNKARGECEENEESGCIGAEGKSRLDEAESRRLAADVIIDHYYQNNQTRAKRRFRPRSYLPCAGCGIGFASFFCRDRGRELCVECFRNEKDDGRPRESEWDGEGEREGERERNGHDQRERERDWGGATEGSEDGRKGEKIGAAQKEKGREARREWEGRKNEAEFHLRALRGTVRKKGKDRFVIIPVRQHLCLQCNKKAKTFCR